MAASTGTAPDEWQCRVFIAAVEKQGTQAAADELTGYRGRVYNRQSVEKTLEVVARWSGQRLLERRGRRLYPTEAGLRFLQAARRVVAEYGIMRGEALDHRTLACLPHHAPMVALAEEILRAIPEESGDLRVEYLDQPLRGESAFHSNAVRRLRDRRYDLIVGPPVPEADCESVVLYTAQLEAMLPVDFPDTTLALAELVGGFRLLVAPPDTRSRKLIEDGIRRWQINDPGVRDRVAMETYEVATSVMYVRQDHRRAARDRLAVVAPSDVALAYKMGMEFGGGHADQFRWVPVQHEGQRLTMEICVTVRRDRDERADLAKVVAALQAAVARHDRTGAVGLTGEP